MFLQDQLLLEQLEHSRIQVRQVVNSLTESQRWKYIVVKGWLRNVYNCYLMLVEFHQLLDKPGPHQLTGFKMNLFGL